MEEVIKATPQAKVMEDRKYSNLILLLQMEQVVHHHIQEVVLQEVVVKHIILLITTTSTITTVPTLLPFQVKEPCQHSKISKKLMSQKLT